jgi:hypothetical protein
VIVRDKHVHEVFVSYSHKVDFESYIKHLQEALEEQIAASVNRPRFVFVSKRAIDHLQSLCRNFLRLVCGFIFDYVPNRFVKILRVGATLKSGATAPVPPHYAEWLLFLFLTADQRKHVPGDLSEEFHDIILPKFGAKRARRWFWFQTARSIADNVGSWPMRLLFLMAGAVGLKEFVEMWRQSK